MSDTVQGVTLIQTVTWALPLACLALWGAVVGGCSSTEAASDQSAAATLELPPAGKREKIRFFFCQWNHFGASKIDDEELMKNLGAVNATVFADWGCSEERARHAHNNGVLYYCGFATAALRGPVKQFKTRLAVDMTGMNCLERHAQWLSEFKEGDKIPEEGPYGSEKNPAYIACPLDRRPWDETMINRAIERARSGLIDGLQADLEPYGAGGFDKAGQSLCYCDHCFGLYLDEKKIDAQVEPKDRFKWLADRKQVEPYLEILRKNIAAMFQSIADDLRTVRPGFGFSAYPAFSVDNIRADWRMQGMAAGLGSPQVPFIVVSSLAYWEDPVRPWWDGYADAYRRLGVYHVLGSWDGALMQGHNETHLSPADQMYESAMAADGFWHWCESDFGPDTWRSFAAANQRIRRAESKLGDFFFKGEPVDHFVTLVEQTGNSVLQRNLVARVWKYRGKYLMWILNGNTDWNVSTRVRLPRVKGKGLWRLHDPLHDTDYTHDNTVTWSAQDLHDGLVVSIEGRGELFLVLERARRATKFRQFNAVPSFDVTAHRPRPEAAEPLPEAEPASAQTIVFERSRPGGYQGPTANTSQVTGLYTYDTDTGKTQELLAIQGYARHPRFSPDRRHVVASVYVNGRGQIYLINAVGGKALNISNNNATDRGPRFTPNGKKILFTSDRDGDWNIYSMNIDGSNQRRLTRSHGTDRSPVVSPDGTKVAFITDRKGDFDVYVMNLDGSDQQPVIDPSGADYEPIWSPDGKMLACSTMQYNKRAIQFVDLETGDSAYLALGFTSNLFSLRFSPDSQKIAAAYSNFGNSGVMIVNVDAKIEPEFGGHWDHFGKTVTVLSKSTSQKPHPDLWYQNRSARPRMVSKTYTGVSFSPDGQTIVYCSDQAEDGMFRLYTVPAAGGEPKPLAEEEAPINWDIYEPRTPHYGFFKHPGGPAGAWPMFTDWATY